MMTFTVDFATIGTVLLVLALSTVLGVALGIAGSLASFSADLFLGIALAVAGERNFPDRRGPSKGPIAFRAVIYVALWVGSIVLATLGFSGWAYLCAVVGGVCLPIAIIRLLK